MHCRSECMLALEKEKGGRHLLVMKRNKIIMWVHWSCGEGAREPTAPLPVKLLLLLLQSEFINSMLLTHFFSFWDTLLFTRLLVIQVFNSSPPVQCTFSSPILLCHFTSKSKIGEENACDTPHFTVNYTVALLLRRYFRYNLYWRDIVH